MSARGPTLKCQVHAVWSGDLTHLRFIAADVCVEEFEQSVEADVSLAVSAALHLLPALRARRLAAHSHANCSHAYTECVCSKRFCHLSKVAPPYLLQYRVLMLYDICGLARINNRAQCKRCQQRELEVTLPLATISRCSQRRSDACSLIPSGNASLFLHRRAPKLSATTALSAKLILCAIQNAFDFIADQA